MPESASPQHSFVPEPVFFNENGRLRDDLLWTIKRGSKLRVAAACFSMNAFEILKSALTQIDELHFLFTSPTFTSTKEEASRREFFIPRRNREQSLYGTEFEVKLRNELIKRRSRENAPNGSSKKSALSPSSATRSVKKTRSSSSTLFRERLCRASFASSLRSFPSSIYDASPQVSWPTGLLFIRRRR